jgi:hypothetical protein
MAATLDLYIDTASGNLVDGGSVVGGALPTLTRNDTYTLRLRLLEKQPNGSLNDIDLSSSSLKAAIGNIEEAPSGGSFKLNINGITSSAIAYNATAISVYTAISNNVSTVALYGSDTYGSYLLTATQPNTAMSFGSDSFTLFPTSSVLVSTRRNPATGIEAQQVVKLVRNPIVYADTFTTASTTSELVLTKLSDGGTGTNETYELTVGPRVRGGLFSLNWGGTSTTGIAPFTSAVSVQGAISSGINTITSNISVQENGKQGYIIQFTGRFAQTNITTALQVDASGVNFIPFQQTTLTINTAEVEDAFADAGTDTITPTLEIELTQGGTPKTVFQGDVTIRKDLITVGSTVPGAQASYYTKTEADNAFVSSQNNVGFYGTTAVSRPANINVVSGLINTGLIASGTTYGVLPSSVETLTETATINYGTLTANTTSAGNVTVTGAATGDLVLVGLPAAVSAGVIVQGVVFAANTVCMTAINATTASRTIGSASYRITVIGY